MTVVCIDSCPSSNNFEKFICRYELQSNVDADSTGALGYEYVLIRQCMYEVKTVEILNRCFPDTNVDQAFELASQVSASVGTNLTGNEIYSTGVSKSSDYLSDFIGDLYYLRAYVFGFGLGVAVFFSFMYLYLMRIPGLLSIIIWTLLIFVFVLITVGAVLLFNLAQTWENEGLKSGTEILLMRGFAFGLFGVAGIYACLLYVMRKRIVLAVGVVKEASKALASMPALLAVPIWQAVGVVCFLVPWMIYTLYLASSGDYKVTQETYEVNGQTVTYSYRTFEYRESTQYALAYMVFCWFWTSNFIVAIGQLTIAGSFAQWYFTRDKRKVGTGTVIRVRTS